MIRSTALCLALSLTILAPALASAETDEKASKDKLVGDWSGVIVLTMGERQEIMPVKMTFSADQKVVLTPLRDSKSETQIWKLDAAKGTLSFVKESGEVDAVADKLRVTPTSLSANVMPGSAGGDAKMSMTLYLGKLPAKRPGK